MSRLGDSFVGAGLLLFGILSQSSTYGLNSYSFGPGGTNSAASSTYRTQSNLGELSNGRASSTTYTNGSGAVQTEQLNLPQAPTLSNGSGTYYNQLQFTLNTGILPSDVTYAVAYSSDNFTTTFYVQSDGTGGVTPFYQTYTAWGGGSGSFIVNLTPSTTYKVKVAAKQGLFTNTAYGPFASASTVAPSITFSLSPNSLSLGSLLAGTVVTSSNISFTFTTNAASGGNIFAAGQNAGLRSAVNNFTIAALTGDLTSSSHGFGLQGVSASQMSIVSPYNGSSNNVGTVTTSYATVFSSAAPTSAGTATLAIKAKSAALDPASSDYQEVLSFVAAANF